MAEKEKIEEFDCILETTGERGKVLGVLREGPVIVGCAGCALPFLPTGPRGAAGLSTEEEFGKKGFSTPCPFMSLFIVLPSSISLPLS